MLVIIYDFDGTLTPYPIAQYQVFKDCGYDDNKYQLRLREIMELKKINLYQAFFECGFQILKENNLPETIDTICKGASEVVFNKGVIDYFENFSRENIHHYVLTSGLVEYVKRTKINKYLKETHGTTLKPHSKKIDQLVTDKHKPLVIQKILELEQVPGENIIYIGDGLTDKYAYSYVHSIGGKSIYLSKDTTHDKIYQELKELNVIDACFEPDYQANKPLYQYIEKLTK